MSCNEESISKKENNSKPNIIYILADDLGYGDVQYFNKDGKIPTPNINSMAN
ncbi:MAG: sulfatase, partial [Flavobacteriaceae bacterium]|nr:sulfatase [Flavobacteriaceae bacterium]